ncbi:MAG TPA: hypothetical protein VNC16_07110 [Solirubrobacterales bacterium]|jgi:hypothetical protein|nr:hypothetical protein [Solirubrobacterales bacterium]
MKSLKTLGLAVLAATSIMAFAASSASATTLEIKGVTQTGPVTITASLKSGNSTILKDTSGFSQNTCTSSDMHGITTIFTGTAVTGPFTEHGGPNPSAGFSLSGCTRTVTIHDPGTFEIVWISGTTNGTVYFENTQVTSGSPIGTLNCTTGATTHIGTLTGVSSGHATLHINALINCGIIPSAKWEGTYTVTSPEGLGVHP